MGLLNNFFTKLDKVKEQNATKAEASAIALKEKRATSIPVIKNILGNYPSTSVKFFDTDAYIFVIENEKERGIYIPYGTTETQIDLKLDKFINNFESASKHKTRGAISKSADLFLKIGEGYDHLNEDMESLEPKQSKNKVKGFWENPPTMKDLDTSLSKRR